MLSGSRGGVNSIVHAIKQNAVPCLPKGNQKGGWRHPNHLALTATKARDMYQAQKCRVYIIDLYVDMDVRASRQTVIEKGWPSWQLPVDLYGKHIRCVD